MRCTSQAMPSTITKPATRRMAANGQPSTNPINTSVAGFNTGLASQKASAAPLDTDWRRMPAATGAAQQVHIMPGSAISAPSTVPEKRRCPSVRATQSRGISTCTSEPSSTPSSAAFHTAVK